MTEGLLGILGHQALELSLGFLVVEEGLPGIAENACELAPRVRGAHVDDTHRRNPRARRLDAEQAWGLAVLHAAPEFALRRQEQVLVERIGRNGDLDPLAAAGDDRKRRQLGIS